MSRKLNALKPQVPHLIFNVPNLKHQDRRRAQACFSQSILYNTKKRTSHSSGKTKHTLEREPHLHIYTGLNSNAQARSKKLIQQLNQMGISISYDIVKQLEELITISLCERFEEDGVVSPACLGKGLFTVGALDNMDYNPSSTTSLTSFHVTGIILFQFPVETKTGENRPSVKIPPSGIKRQFLPDNMPLALL
ncbi:hypothetical protein LSAT2_005639 [Lamellibrachia satsuma]|nr:hypothetical protein LSAT2_005639 [Lamellibrachia satsuma]